MKKENKKAWENENWETVERKKKIPLFQAFKDQEEYAEEFNGVLNTIPKKKRYIFATFMMRLNQSIREGHYSE